MTDPQTLDTLNRLLAAESGSLLARMPGVDPYTTLVTAEDRRLLDDLRRDVERHKLDIVRLIYDLRGVPDFPPPDPRVAGFHYVDLARLMPLVIGSLQSLIAAYESAGATGHRDADALVARHLADYRRHLATLQKMHGHLLAASA